MQKYLTIDNPNSCGQGHNPHHADNPFHASLVEYGWNYSHTTRISGVTNNGMPFAHHTYILGTSENCIGVSCKESGYTLEASKFGSGICFKMTTQAQLTKYLKRKLREFGRCVPTSSQQTKIILASIGTNSLTVEESQAIAHKLDLPTDTVTPCIGGWTIGHYNVVKLGNYKYNVTRNGHVISTGTLASLTWYDRFEVREGDGNEGCYRRGEVNAFNAYDAMRLASRRGLICKPYDVTLNAIDGDDVNAYLASYRAPIFGDACRWCAETHRVDS
jgi:hypothetical protein